MVLLDLMEKKRYLSLPSIKNDVKKIDSVYQEFPTQNIYKSQEVMNLRIIKIK